VPSLNKVFEFGANTVLAPFGYELMSTILTEGPEGFHEYLRASKKSGMDVNDWEEQELAWKPALPILEQVVFPYLGSNSIACELGPGTGRFSRHIVRAIPEGQLHLVDHSPWMVNFLRKYFQSDERVLVHLGDGSSLPFTRDSWIDVVFSNGTLIALKLGVIYLYARDFFRVLRPGGRAIFDYIDPTTPEGWAHLESQRKHFADVYTYHAPTVIDRVLASAGFEAVERCQLGKSTYVIATKARSES
jgi:ubiquinone/menaquinone biosynthesis C-methylase UbiE